MWPRMLVMLLMLRVVQAGPEEEEEEKGPIRPYAVLQSQNLVLMGTVFGLLLVAMVLMAVCVYKPVRRR